MANTVEVIVPLKVKVPADMNLDEVPGLLTAIIEAGQADAADSQEDPDFAAAAASAAAACSLEIEAGEPLKPKHYVLTVTDCIPWLNGPFTTPQERDGLARTIVKRDFKQGEDDIAWLDQAPDGTLNVGVYTDEDLLEAEYNDG